RLRGWRELRRFLRRTRPDLVVSYLSYFSVLSAALAARSGARVVFNQQTPMSAFLEDADYHWRQPWHRRLFAMVAAIGYRLPPRPAAQVEGVGPGALLCWRA